MNGRCLIQQAEIGNLRLHIVISMKSRACRIDVIIQNKAFDSAMHRLSLYSTLYEIVDGYTIASNASQKDKSFSSNLPPNMTPTWLRTAVHMRCRYLP